MSSEQAEVEPMIELTGPQLFAFASFASAYGLGMAAGALAGVIPIWTWHPFGISIEVQTAGVAGLMALFGFLFIYLDTRLE